MWPIKTKKLPGMMILEIANNHMGNVAGLALIERLSEVTKEFQRIFDFGEVPIQTS